MEYKIKHSPAYALLDIYLEPNETLKTESGSMVYMENHFDVSTTMSTNIFSALVRKIFGGESFFFNLYRSKQKARIGISSTLPGDIYPLKFNNQHLICQSNAYLASTSNIHIKTKWGGLRSFFSKEGLFWLDVHGTGDVFLASYGAIVEIDVEGSYIVDTGHIVAFDSSLNYQIKKFGGWKSLFLSGEGLTMEFTGHGKLYIQTRLSQGFLNWIMRFLPS